MARNPSRALRSGEDDRLPVAGDVCLHPEVAANPLRERLRRVRIAVDDEDGLRPLRGGIAGAPEVTEPRLELVLVRVGGEAADRADAAADGDLLAVDPCRLPTVLDVASERALALVADEEEGALRVGEEVLEVMI
jgi:hypothetical protein